MIVISGTIVIDPAKVDEALVAVRELETATRAEDGNLEYGFWLSHSDPGTFHVFEKWADDDAVNAHMASDHMLAFLTAAGGFGITSTELTRYDISGTTKFM